MIRRVLHLAAAFAVGALLVSRSAAAAGGEVVDRIVAVVNDEVIALSEVYDLGAMAIAERCKPPRTDLAACIDETERQVLDALIQQTLIRQELEEADLGVSEADLDRAIDGIVRDNNLPDRGAFEQALSLQGVSWEAYRQDLERQLAQLKFAQSFLYPRVSITEDELRDQYNRTVRSFSTGTKRAIELVAVPWPTTESLGEVRDELEAEVAATNAGERTWADLLAEVHTPGLVGVGADGRFDTQTRDGVAPAFQGVFDVPLNEVIGPVEVSGVGLFLLRATDEVAADVQPFEDVRDQLAESLRREKVEEELVRWVEAEKRRAAIRILLDG